MDDCDIADISCVSKLRVFTGKFGIIDSRDLLWIDS